MKMYHFNPNDYGEEYFVMAENKEDAHENLLNHLKDKVEYAESDVSAENHQRILDTWLNSLKSFKLPKDYTLEEYDVGEVIEAERS